MPYYVKANKLVANYLGKSQERNQLKDGNYLLWQADLQPFGSLSRLQDIAKEIGGLLLTSAQAREEQDGVTLRSLPTATDVRFYIAPEELTEEKTQNESADNITVPTETNAAEVENTPTVDDEADATTTDGADETASAELKAETEDTPSAQADESGKEEENAW